MIGLRRKRRLDPRRLAVVAGGLHDLASHGAFLHSAWANVTAQWAEGGADQFGVGPWWHYLVEGALKQQRLLVIAPIHEGLLPTGAHSVTTALRQ